MKNHDKKENHWKKQTDIEILLARFRNMMDCFSCNDTLENLISQANPAPASDNNAEELSLEELDSVAAAGRQASMKKIYMEKTKHDY